MKTNDDPVGSKHVATLITINQLCLTENLLLAIPSENTSRWLPSKIFWPDDGSL